MQGLNWRQSPAVPTMVAASKLGNSSSAIFIAANLLVGARREKVNVTESEGFTIGRTPEKYAKPWRSAYFIIAMQTRKLMAPPFGVHSSLR